MFTELLILNKGDGRIRLVGTPVRAARDVNGRPPPYGRREVAPDWLRVRFLDTPEERVRRYCGGYEELGARLLPSLPAEVKFTLATRYLFRLDQLSTQDLLKIRQGETIEIQGPAIDIWFVDRLLDARIAYNRGETIEG